MCSGDGGIDGEFGSGYLELDRITGYARKLIQQAARNASLKSGGRVQLKV